VADKPEEHPSSASTRSSRQLYPCLLDSGCELSLAPLELVKATNQLEIGPTSKSVYVANGTPIRVVGATTIPLVMEGYTAGADVLVSEDIEEVMLGINWLSTHNL